MHTLLIGETHPHSHVKAIKNIKTYHSCSSSKIVQILKYYVRLHLPVIPISTEMAKFIPDYEKQKTPCYAT